MKFSDLNSTTQDKIIELLNQHLASSASILKTDHCLLPMMLIPDTKQLISLQSDNKNIDVDKAYSLVIEKLKQENFTYALFSYSTKIYLTNNAPIDALKTYIFTKDGIQVSFYSPYYIKGLFKKTITIEKTILDNILENVLN